MTDIKLDKIEYSFSVTLDREELDEFYSMISTCKDLLYREGQKVTGEKK